MSKLFNINAGIRLPDNFVGSHEEALTYLLYEVQRQEHLKDKPKASRHKGDSQDTLVWLQESKQDIWYQVSLLDECYITEEDQDSEDAEIDAILLSDESPS